MGAVKSGLSKCRGAITHVFGLALVIFSDIAVAAGSDLGSVATNIIGSFTAVTKLISATAYLAGMGFAVGAVIKFKAHKDNPQQTPIGQPVGLLIVAAALLFLPSILTMAGATIFGTSPTTAGPSGTVF